MKGKIADYCRMVLSQDEFPQDFYNEQTHLSIAKTCEYNSNEMIQLKYDRTTLSFDENLTIKNSSAKTKMVLFYPSKKYLCNSSPHYETRYAVMLFGTKNDNGHAFAICPDCLFTLSLILLRYYKYRKLYFYSSRKNFIRLERNYDRSECYLCRRNSGEQFKISFHKRNFTLCESCLESFTDLILTSPTTETLFPYLTNEYIKVKNRHKKSD